MAPRGERFIMRVPAGQFTRLRYNPFFDYLEKRVIAFLEAGED